MFYAQKIHLFPKIHIFYIYKKGVKKAPSFYPLGAHFSTDFNLESNQYFKQYYLKNPLTISSSASFSVSPKVISFTNCSPAILPIAAS